MAVYSQRGLLSEQDRRAARAQILKVQQAQAAPPVTAPQVDSQSALIARLTEAVKAPQHPRTFTQQQASVLNVITNRVLAGAHGSDQEGLLRDGLVSSYVEKVFQPVMSQLQPDQIAALRDEKNPAALQRLITTGQLPASANRTAKAPTHVAPLFDYVANTLDETLQNPMGLGLIRQGFVANIEGQLAHSGLTADQKTAYLQTITTALPDAKAFSAPLAKILIDAYPRSETSKDPLRKEMEAGVAAFAAGNPTLVFYQKHTGQDLINDPVVNRAKLVRGLSKELKLPQHAINVLEAVGNAHGRAQQEAALLRFAEKHTGAKIPVPLDVLKGGAAAIKKYAEQKHGPLPFGLTWNELARLRKNPKADISSTAQWNMAWEHNYLFNPNFYADVERHIRNHPTVRLASSVANNPAVRELQRDESLLKSPSVQKAIPVLREAREFERSTQAGSQLGHQIVQTTVGTIRDRVPKAADGQIPVPTQRVLADLSRMTPAKLAQQSRASIETRIVEATVLDNLGLAAPTPPAPASSAAPAHAKKLAKTPKQAHRRDHGSIRRQEHDGHSQERSQRTRQHRQETKRHHMRPDCP